MPPLTKKRILDLIKSTAAENGGEVLGVRKFEAATGIRQSDWRGIHWVKWSDAIAEAGLALTTEFTKRYDDEHLLASFVALIRDLGHYPVNAEVRLRASTDATFPNDATFRRFGSKSGMVRRVLDYAKQHPGHEDVVAICEPLALRAADSTPEEGDTPDDGELTFGDVYLLKSGKHYKIGRSNSAGRRGRELEIQLPEKATFVHVIRTDDPVGIEGYWHRRFADRRLNGEWFALTAADVSAFRRRKGFM